MAGVGLWLRQRRAVRLAVAIAAATALAFAAFGAHALAGGAGEQRTPNAMSLRALAWAGIATNARRVVMSKNR